MRVDKFLWCTRYFNMAAEAIKKGHVSVNGQVAKASREVYATDKIVLRKDQINYQFTILDIPQSRVGAKLVDVYRKDTTPDEAFAHLEMLKLSKEYYRAKGEGRPTKKDRRDIDDYTNDIDFDDDFE